jgi:hypothetical protein
MTKRFFAFEYTPNGNCSYLGNGRLLTFASKRARDAWVKAAPAWGDFYLGARLPVRARALVRPHWSHKATPAGNATF